MMDPYEILDVSPNASPDEIKSAYRRLIKQYHPDKNNTQEANDRVRMINAAYEILSDPEKSKQYQAAFAGVEFEEDPIERYKREFQRKRWEKAQAKKARQLARAKITYKVFRILTFPILVFAVILLMDDFLPLNAHNEIPVYGWQDRLGGGRRSRGELVSYLETPNFFIRVPHQFHLTYPYYDENKPPVTIFATPILGIPRTLHCSFAGNFWRIDILGTIHSQVIPIRWMLLLSSLFIVSRKEYSTFNYMFCFLPALILAHVIVIMA